MHRERNTEMEPEQKNVAMTGKSKEDCPKRAGGDAERLLLCKLGETLQKKRLENGYSQEQLCSVTNMNRTYLSDIERGVSNPSFLVLWKLAGALRTDLWQIIQSINAENYKSGGQ